MTKVINLRVEVPADDGVTTEALQKRLRDVLRGMASGPIEEGDRDLLGAPIVFWPASDVKRGPETRPQRAKRPSVEKQ